MADAAPVPNRDRPSPAREGASSAAGGLLQAIGSSTFRLAALIVATFAVATAVIVWLLYTQTTAVLTEQVVAGLRGEAEALRVVARQGGPAALDAAIARRSAAPGPMLYRLSGDGGQRIAGNLPADALPEGGPVQPGVVRYRPAGPAAGDGAPRAAVVLPVDVGPGRTLVIGRDIEELRGFAEGVRSLFLYGFGGLALAGLAGGLAMSRYALRRIEAINAAAREIMAGDLGRRIPASGAGDEIDGLADNLNAMLDRIEQLMAGLREVSDNIAHDLKTPLNRLRQRAETALRGPAGAAGYREGLEQTIEAADDLIKTFNALLLIARLEAGAVEETAEDFDAAALVRDVADLYEPVAEEAGLAFAVDAAAAAMVRANRQLVGQAVANLIDNAIKYGGRGETWPGGGVGASRGADVSVRVVRADGGVEIRVADRGPGIPAEDRERALKRFVRLDRSRSKPGTGLGLSLVAAVARLHHGRVRLGDNAPGLEIALWLPVHGGV